jgi:uncharacterized protein (DUF4415 family)
MGGDSGNNLGSSQNGNGTWRDFKRPSGTRLHRSGPHPALRTPGYFRWSLRDRHLSFELSGDYRRLYCATRGASSRRGDRSRMNGGSTGATSSVERVRPNGSKITGSRPKRPKSKRRSGTDWGRLRRMTDSAIRQGIAADPDAQATHEQFWKTAKVVMPTPKEIVTMRLDADLLRWFRQQRGYQTRINAILRAYMQAHESV